MAYQVSGNRPPKLVKDSYFERWTVAFIKFISSRENGDLMIKSFTEGPLVLYKREEDFSEEEIKQMKADKHALSCLLSVLPQHIYMHVAAYKTNPMQLWNALTKEMLGSKVEFKVIEEKKVEIEDSEKMNELTRRLQEVKDLLILEREDHKKEKEGLVQRISDLDKELKMKNKDCEDIKVFELKFRKLSKQNSDFQKVLFLEKEKLEKERVDFEVQRKGFEVKNRKLSDKISKIQEELVLERSELEKTKKTEFQTKSEKDDFSVERKIFQKEIQKLTKNLAGLSADIMKEKRVNCDIRKTLDLMTKERNNLSDKVRSFNKSGSFSGSPIRPSNLFYDRSVDKSSKSFSDLPSFKKINMQWRVKGTTPKPSASNTNTKLKDNSFATPVLFYSTNQLLRLAQKNICCSHYGTNECVHKDYTSFWYDTYHFPSYRAPFNKPGPKTRWVPKST